jgi:hypothetical protein
MFPKSLSATPAANEIHAARSFEEWRARSNKGMIGIVQAMFPTQPSQKLE